MKSWLFAFILSSIAILASVSPASAANYYVDSVGGNDSNSGTTLTTPWRTLTPVANRTFSPGDTINLKRGSLWSGGLTIPNSGTSANPITYIAYGTGNAPIIEKNIGDSWSNCITINGDYVVVDGIKLQNTHDAGIYISYGADHNTIRNVEVTNAGFGITNHGRYTLITQSYFHDLKMVFNTVGGGSDDYGAVGVNITTDNNEVSYNRFINCIAPSYDFGVDGGAIEFYGGDNPDRNLDYNYIHHNYASGNKGFVEVGIGHANNVRFAYNVSVNNGRFSVINMGDQFGATIFNFKVENNTIVETANTSQGWAIFGFGAATTPDMFLARNNIIYVSWYKYIANLTDYAGSAITHQNNLYYFTDPRTVLGYSLGSGESMSNPGFVNLPGLDFHLQSGSPAINAGLGLGYTLDFENHQVPSGNAPDIGAYEYSSSIPTIVPTPTSPPASTPPATLPGDANRDGTVNVSDITFVANNWTQPITPALDQFIDGNINSLDVAKIISFL
jgi:hypothetical protein